ncbi:MAG: CRISPR-associated endonuclease Cas2 [Bacteroidaceae bacterium]|nr:CRISPR-associated endonuclease Cas2 [Bacteroidaceae bacterium]
MAKKKQELTFPQKLAKLYRAGVQGSKMVSTSSNGWESLESIEKRIERVIGIANNKERNVTDMLFFVMYDIESNKVRQQVSKYLLKMGCFRIQRSIFLADLSPEKYEQIRSDLTEVQAFYENEDSILVVPVSTDLLKSMRIIGKTIDVDIIMRTKNTLFF